MLRAPTLAMFVSTMDGPSTRDILGKWDVTQHAPVKMLSMVIIDV